MKKESALLPPLLLAAYSVLALYGHNINEVTPTDGLPLLGGVLLGTLVLVGVLRWWLGDPNRAGVAATVLVAATLYYGLLFKGADQLLGGHLGHKIFLPLIALATLGLSWRLARSPHVEAIGRFFLAATLVLLASPLFQVVSHQLQARKTELPDPDHLIPVTPAARKVTSDHPHVYYLILDRYAGHETLKQQYGFANDAFYASLASHGFLIARQAFANYTKTAHSLASSLNMIYLDDLARQLQGVSADFTPLHRMIRDNRIWRQFRALGYPYIHIGSRWTATRFNPHAQENYNLLPPSGFRELYLDQTLFLAIKNRVSGSQAWWERLCAEHRYQFRVLQRLAGRPEPFFAFAHVLLPHPPFVFDAEGRCVDPHARHDRPRKQNYLDQLRYTNRLLTQTIEEIQDRDPRAVIILQADEGPYPDRYDQDEEGFDWRQATIGELRQKFLILLAIRAPGLHLDELPADTSPVNVFRILFGRLYGLKIDALPNHAFTFIDGRHLYDFIEITNQLKIPADDSQ